MFAELTLNQALSSWVMERHLESTGFPLHIFAPQKVIGFSHIVQNCYDLPHPAMKKIEFLSNVKSSEMAKLVFNLLGVVVTTLYEGKKRNISDLRGLQTVRLNGGNKPCPVQLFPSANKQTIHTIDICSNELINDNPAMNPQYVSSFGLSMESESIWLSGLDKRKKSSHTVPFSSYLFQKVFLIDGGVDDTAGVCSLSTALTKLMKR